MAKLNFFTPATYNNSSPLEVIDNYFYLGGKKAYVIQGRTKTGQEKVVLSEARCSTRVKVGKVFSYFTVIIPLVMLIAKASLRSKHDFKVIDPKKKLEKGMDNWAVDKIERLIPQIIAGKEEDAIEWLSTGNNLVFKLKESPNIVYKMADPAYSVWNGTKSQNSKERSDERFDNMIKAKRVCLINDLGLLKIPHAAKFDIEVDGVTYTLIAEESLDFEPTESAQEELYHTYSTELNETARELATFIAKTGFNDVTWRNIPILNEAPEYQGQRRVALIDLEHMRSAENGFLGDGNGSCGLVHCVGEDQIDVVLAEARKQGVKITSQQAKYARKYRRVG